MSTSSLRQHRQKPASDRHLSFSLNPYLSFFTRTALFSVLALFLLIALFSPYSPSLFSSSSSSSSSHSKWQSYTLSDAAAFVANTSSTVIVCAVSQPYIPFLSNWLISISRHNRHHNVLVIAEDYSTLYLVNDRWPGHAVLIPPAPDSQTAHKFGSQGFFNFTSRRLRHLLQILELGFSVMYNDVDMVWLGDPFKYLEGEHDVYFTDDMAAVKPLHLSHDLPLPGKKGRTYICSCMIYLRPTEGAKLVMKKWIEILKEQPWSKKAKANDQPAFNWALNKTAGQDITMRKVIGTGRKQQGLCILDSPFSTFHSSIDPALWHR